MGSRESSNTECARVQCLCVCYYNVFLLKVFHRPKGCINFTISHWEKKEEYYFLGVTTKCKLYIAVLNRSVLHSKNGIIHLIMVQVIYSEFIVSTHFRY